MHRRLWKHSRRRQSSYFIFNPSTIHLAPYSQIYFSTNFQPPQIPKDYTAPEISNIEDDDILQATPWKTLLYHPARALWRTTPSFSMSKYRNPSTNTVHDDTNAPPKITQQLIQEQYKILQDSQRTKKQLHRTHDKLLSRQKEFTQFRIQSSKSEHPRKSLPKDSLAAIQQNLHSKHSLITNLGYKPEHTCVYLHHRLLPNYFILVRILSEIQSILSTQNHSPNPVRKVLDFGIGCGSASAAALQVFQDSLQWIHGIDTSQSMKEVSSHILNTLKDDNVRITMGDGLTSSYSSSDIRGKEKDHQNSLGSFDLALFCHTAQDMPSLPAILSTAAILWEKLNDGGILVMVEPGTPDGFQSIRSVREMLLECCPPQNVPAVHSDDWREEAHVLAPCTHNGTCPMNSTNFVFPRHLKGKDNSEMEEIDLDWEYDIDYDSDDEDMALLEDGWVEYDPNIEQEETLTTAKINDSAESTEEEQDSLKRDYLSQNDIFENSFCSFVHALPSQDLRRSQWTRKKGEKFSYIVLQKRVVGSSSENNHSDGNGDNNENNHEQSAVPNVNIVDLLAETMDTADRVHSNMIQKDNSHLDASSSHDASKLNVLFSQAVTLEKELLKSYDNTNSLGLQYVNVSSKVYNENKDSSDTSNQTMPWGRLVRAPLKKRGHISMDYCTGNNGTEGRIIRHQISKGKSARMAPGLYAAARKARWGGLWPDLSTYDDREKSGDDLQLINEDSNTPGMSSTQDELFLAGMKDIISEGKDDQ